MWSFKRLSAVVGSSLCLIASMPMVASAQTVSVSQTITVTARVEDKRSIVVNDRGDITKIYSNTAKNVTPGVYLYDVPGKQLPLTPALLERYQTIIDTQDNLVGVAIPVEQPVANSKKLPTVITQLISLTIRPISQLY